MDKNKSFYLTLVVIFCVVLSGLGGYFIGINFGKGEVVVRKNDNNDNKVIEKESKEEDDIEVLELTSSVNVAIYNYLQSDSTDLISYLNGLSNSQKLYVAGLQGDDTFTNLKEDLVDLFGTDLNIKAEDYYVGNTLQATYNAESDKYTWVGDYDLLFDFESKEVFNYRLENTTIKDDEYVVTFYGLYTSSDNIGPTTATNDKNINCLLDYEENQDTSNDECLDNAFVNSKDDFLKISYIYKKINDKYVLVDVKLV